MSPPRRWKSGCSATVTVRYRSPRAPPVERPPSPDTRTREPVFTPAGVFTSRSRGTRRQPPPLAGGHRRPPVGAAPPPVPPHPPRQSEQDLRGAREAPPRGVSI